MHRLARPRRSDPRRQLRRTLQGGNGRDLLRGGLRTGKVNDVALARYKDLDPEGIIELVARNQRPSGLPSGFKGGIALTDGTIHHQTSDGPSVFPRAIPAHRLVPVLTFSLGAPTLPSKGNAKGLKLVATDVDWTAGDGPQVTGPGEALLMAAAGRAQALEDLSGDGLPTCRNGYACTTHWVPETDRASRIGYSLRGQWKVSTADKSAPAHDRTAAPSIRLVGSQPVRPAAPTVEPKAGRQRRRRRR